MKDAKELLKDLYKTIEGLGERLEAKETLIRKLREEKNELSRFNIAEVTRLKEEHKRELKEIQKEIDGLEKQINELIEQIQALTSPPAHVGKLIKVMDDGTALILDNHKTVYRTLISPKIDAKKLEEGDEIECVVNEAGKPTAIFAVRKPRRDEEIIVIKELIDEDTALAVFPGDTLKIVNIAKRAKGTLEKGDEVFYDAAINFVTTKVPKEKEKVDLRHVVKKTYKDIGGLAEQIRKVREVVELPLKHPELFEKAGILAPKGILLSGPPGCGKTLIGQVVANECGVYFIHVSGPEFMSPYPGEPEAKLRGIFDAARRYAPAIIFLDEIEAIAEKREEAEHGHERRLVSQLLSLMDGLTSREQVIVIAATNRPDILDIALRRPGRFDREIVIPIPDRDGRLEILKILAKNMPLASDVNLEEIANNTHGFTGADLEALCKEAAMLIFKNLDFGNLDLSQVGKMEVPAKYFETVLANMKPTLMREVTLQKPKETWADVGGLEDVKDKLTKAIVWPLVYPELLKTAGLKPAKGILLYGPPGCGKTLVAKAMANECGSINFIAVKGPELLSKWVGESESNVRKLFDKARQSAPCIIFFDEIEAMVTMRGRVSGDSGVGDKVTSSILTEMQGIEDINGVFILAATNRLELVDSALLRRFDEIIYLPPPNEQAREEIIKIHTRGKPLAEDVDFKVLAKKMVIPAGTRMQVSRTEYIVLKADMPFSGDEIAKICQKATLRALDEFVKTHDPKTDYANFKIEMRYFLEIFQEFGESLQSFAKDETSRKEGTPTSPETKEIKEITDKDLEEVL